MEDVRVDFDGEIASLAERTKYDLWYVENWSLWLDIKILLRTLVQPLTFRSPNAY